jgi:hypothetical protein
MHLRVIGYGMNWRGHLTLEGLAEIRRCRAILYLPTIRGEIEEVLNELNITNHEDISALYCDGDIDTENYRRIYQRTMLAVRQFGDVGLLYPGHPRVGVTPVQWFRVSCRASGIRLTVVPAISSFDTMINDLERDALEFGSVLVDANRMLDRNIPLISSLDYYIYHVCAIGTSRTNLSDPLKDSAWPKLVEHVKQFRKPEHPVMLIQSAAADYLSSTCLTETVGSLFKIGEHIGFGTTLFVPAQS